MNDEEYKDKDEGEETEEFLGKNNFHIDESFGNSDESDEYIGEEEDEEEEKEDEEEEEEY